MADLLSETKISGPRHAQTVKVTVKDTKNNRDGHDLSGVAANLTLTRSGHDPV